MDFDLHLYNISVQYLAPGHFDILPWGLGIKPPILQLVDDYTSQAMATVYCRPNMPKQNNLPYKTTNKSQCIIQKWLDKHDNTPMPLTWPLNSSYALEPNCHLTMMSVQLLLF